jgi:cyanobactin maturation PatA/PatG family protease
MRVKFEQYLEPAVSIDVNVNDSRQMAQLDRPENPFVASNVIWTLNLDATPVYAIRPQGPFAGDIYEVLRVFFKQQQLQNGAERVAIPGYLVGQTRLLNGQVVPVILPERMGLDNWNTGALALAIRQNIAPNDQLTQEQQDLAGQEIGRFLDRIHHEFRNLGITPQDRALNYAATNALVVSEAIAREAGRGYRLDSVEVGRSPICRLGSDCWDVTLTFFHPSRRLEMARTVSKVCVDVTDVVPVIVGKERSWYVN